MNFKPTKQELVLVLMAVVLGTVLRMAHSERLAVEHFDEGVYSSVLWYDDATGQSYPMRHLYAPPLLPAMISVVAAVPGLEDIAPFLPSMIFGALTIIVLWAMARAWFGINAGYVIAFVVGMSDFHILFSRMALTDVPALFWICSAVGIAASGIHRQSKRQMIVAGVLTGIAWWTKYTGWLPLAIVVSGSGFWWLVRGRSTLSIGRLSLMLVTMAVVAFAVWSPVLWMLQEHGGYAAVKANHAGYFNGFDGWKERLTDQLTFHFRLDSWFGAAAIGIGLLAAGTQRWFGLRRSTWNHPQTSPSAESGVGSAADVPDWTPPPALLARFIVAAIALAIMANGIGTIGLLTCIGIGGMSGTFLWRTLTQLHGVRATAAGRNGHDGSREKPAPNTSSAIYNSADLAAAPTIDPMLGACLVVTWFCGMMLTTPMYHPYPRLSLPLLTSIWLAAAGGLSWWVEATINVSRRDVDGKVGGRLESVQRIVMGVVTVLLVMTILGTATLQRSWIWQDRTSLRDTAWFLGDAAIKDAADEYEVPEQPSFISDSGIISPDAEDEYDEEGNPILQPTALQQLQSLVQRWPDDSAKLADLSKPTCVIYCFGDPSVLKHLHDAGIQAAPVQDLSFPSSKLEGEPLPTYLVLGPYAIRTPGLFEQWATQQHRFDHVADFHFAPSEVVQFNLFAPKWIAQHDEVAVQRLELHRLKAQE